MKAIVGVCLAALWPVSAFAGNIFGSISENRQPAKSVEVVVLCGANSFEARTDDAGSYSLRANEPGRCTFRVNYKGQTAETEIFSYDQPTRYDFELVMTNGKYALKKK
jgi:hypothetical protein